MDECIAKVYFGQNEDKYVIKKCVTFIFDKKDIEDIENVEDAFYSLFDSENDSCRSRVFQDIDEFLAAINRIESINDYTYYLTKNYWTFVCISDSIFI